MKSNVIFFMVRGKKEIYDKEITSTIIVIYICCVRGYDNDFKIMAYSERNGSQYEGGYFYYVFVRVHFKMKQDVFATMLDLF